MQKSSRIAEISTKVVGATFLCSPWTDYGRTLPFPPLIMAMLVAIYRLQCDLLCYLTRQSFYALRVADRNCNAIRYDNAGRMKYDILLYNISLSMTHAEDLTGSQKSAHYTARSMSQGSLAMNTSATGMV